MERQLLDVRKRALDQYDGQISQLKKAHSEDRENTQYSQLIANVQIRFRRNLTEITNELMINAKQQDVYVSLLLSLPLPLPLPLSLCLCLSLYLSVSVAVAVYVCLSLCRSLGILCMFVSMSLSTFMPIHPSQNARAAPDH
jgi:hypothetical protein